MIRTLDIIRLVFDILRPTYSLTVDANGNDKLNVVYRYLATCFKPILALETEYETLATKYYALADNNGTVISIQAYLNHYYGSYGTITITNAPVFETFLYPYIDATGTGAQIMNPYGEGEPIILYNYGSTANSPLVSIPLALQQDTTTYENFIADLNAMVYYGIQYAITTYE